VGSGAPPTPARFAHDSERDFAAVLDAFGVAWQYEPTTFVLRHDERGRPLEAFTPDFYLPDHDVYVELTTLRQALVTRKNAKVRRLAALRPEVRVKVLYRRDWAVIQDRFGLAAPPPSAATALDASEPTVRSPG
jgi:hypoxanthine phosphoribosyltransferase